MEDMSKWERVKAALKGKPVDRVPISCFMHNYAAENGSPDVLAAHLIKQNSNYGWDFIKIQLGYTWYAEAWGCKYNWDSSWCVDIGPQPILDTLPVKRGDDLGRLKKPDSKSGVITNQVKVASILSKNLKGELPVIQTTFSPLMIVNMLQGWVGESAIQTAMAQKYMRETPELMHHALSVISQTMADYARESVRAGADGIFMTTSPWTQDWMTDDEYLTFGKPYELPIYKAALEEGATLNVLHICKDNIFFDALLDYPVQLIQFENTSPRNPSLCEAMARTEKALWAGVSHRSDSPLVIGPIEAIAAQVHSALDETGGRRFVLGAVCTFSPSTPEAHIRALKEAIYTWQASHGK